jgi:hypothetical protein
MQHSSHGHQELPLGRSGGKREKRVLHPLVVGVADDQRLDLADHPRVDVIIQVVVRAAGEDDLRRGRGDRGRKARRHLHRYMYLLHPSRSWDRR